MALMVALTVSIAAFVLLNVSVDPAQAIAVGEELLKSGGPDRRREALRILGEAYLQQHKHERAALAFAGMLPEQAGADEK